MTHELYAGFTRIEQKPVEGAQRLITTKLAVIYEHLMWEEVEEIAINRPRELWVKLRRADAQGRLWVKLAEPRLSKNVLVNLCYYIANFQQIGGFGPEGVPVVFGTLPGGHRFGGAIGHNIQYGLPDQYDDDGSVCMCIRRYADEFKANLVDYGIKPGTMVQPALNSLFNKDGDPDDDYVKIVNSLTRGDHILVSGATGTGKTTFLNRLIEHIDARKRIITVEDTRELRVRQENRVHIVMSRTNQSNDMTYNRVRDLIVRMTPDIVLAGEISNSNAAVTWELMTTGHGHFMTTIHAESEKEAIETFAQCIANSRSASGTSDAVDWGALKTLMAQKLRIIQLNKDAFGQRRATRIS